MIEQPQLQIQMFLFPFNLLLYDSESSMQSKVNFDCILHTETEELRK